jgi:hypothetical protein
MNDNGKYWGKYKGIVVQNIDPLQRGRLLVQIPEVLGPVPSTWAEASVPLAGPTGPPAGMYVVPPIGAGVWVEFEHGDPDKPIWVGCRWGAQTDIPLAAHAGNPALPSIVVQSPSQQGIIISDIAPAPGLFPVMPPTPPTGGIILRSSVTGAFILVNDVGVFISDGKGGMISVTNGSVILGCPGSPLALVVK